MKSRRDFLRTSLVGGALAAVGALGIPETAKPAEKQFSDVDFPWCRTIFCQFENRTLKNALEDYAQRTGCTVEFARIGYPDLLAIGGGFVHIVDRTTFTSEDWQTYVDWSDEVFDTTPLILVDSDQNLPRPKTRCYVGQYDMTSEIDIDLVLDIAKRARSSVALRRFFEEPHTIDSSC